jgi:hypothetical protein
VANKYLFLHNFDGHKVFSEVYYRYCEPLLDSAQVHDTICSFTDIDVPWKKDDLRDKAEGRESVLRFLKNH